MARHYHVYFASDAVPPKPDCTPLAWFAVLRPKARAFGPNVYRAWTSRSAANKYAARHNSSAHPPIVRGCDCAECAHT